MGQLLWKTVWRLLRKLQIVPPFIQQFHFWVCIQKNWNQGLKEIFAPPSAFTLQPGYDFGFQFQWVHAPVLSGMQSLSPYPSRHLEIHLVPFPCHPFIRIPWDVLCLAWKFLPVFVGITALSWPWRTLHSLPIGHQTRRTLQLMRLFVPTTKEEYRLRSHAMWQGKIQWPELLRLIHTATLPVPRRTVLGQVHWCPTL